LDVSLPSTPVTAVRPVSSTLRIPAHHRPTHVRADRSPAVLRVTGDGALRDESPRLRACLTPRAMITAQRPLNDFDLTESNARRDVGSRSGLLSAHDGPGEWFTGWKQ
jgi:hypothetical protein